MLIWSFLMRCDYFIPYRITSWLIIVLIFDLPKTFIRKTNIFKKMDDFNFNSWAKKQTKYFGDPSTGNRNDLKMDISNCAMTIQQWEHIKNSYFLIIILCCIIIIYRLFKVRHLKDKPSNLLCKHSCWFAGLAVNLFT